MLIIQRFEDSYGIIVFIDDFFYISRFILLRYINISL